MQTRFSTVITVSILVAILAVALWFTYRALQVKPEETDAGMVLFGDTTGQRFVSVTGQTVNLEQNVGERALYINSWASWSPLSKDELIALNEIALEYKDKPIKFIALNRKEPKEMATRYLDTLPPLANLEIVIDAEDHVYSAVGGYAMPESLLYKADGTLWQHVRQPQSKEAIRTLVEELLKEE